MANTASLKQYYKESIVPALTKQFGYTTVHRKTRTQGNAHCRTGCAGNRNPCRISPVSKTNPGVGCVESAKSISGIFPFIFPLFSCIIHIKTRLSLAKFTNPLKKKYLAVMGCTYENRI